jgi:hypothetical protein
MRPSLLNITCIASWDVLLSMVINILNIKAADASRTLVTIHRGPFHHISRYYSLAINNCFFIIYWGYGFWIQENIQELGLFLEISAPNESNSWLLHHRYKYRWSMLLRLSKIHPQTECHLHLKRKLNSVDWVCERTPPTEQLPPVSEVSANICR